MSFNHRLLLSAAAFSTATAVALLAALPAQAQANRNVTIVLPDEPIGLDPCNSDTSTLGRINRQNIVETLTEIDPQDGSIKPRLATSWQKVNDTTWRFKLREGVTYHDGAPFNAETAVTSIMRTLATDSVVKGDVKTGLDCSTRTIFFKALKLTPKAIDATTLEIVTEPAAPILPTQVGLIMLASPNTPKDKLTLAPIGTGPYVFDHWTAGQEVVIKRNEKYWGAKPQVEQAKYVWRNESSVRAAMVKIGEADIAPVIAAQEATDPSMDYSYLNSETVWLRIQTAEKPLDDIRVRLAMNYAVDRNALRGSLFPKGVIPATQIVVPSIAGHNHELDKKVYAYDPAKAKQLIAEAKAAGTPVDKEIQLIGRTNFFPNAQEVMEAVGGMFKAVGLNTKISMLEAAVWTDLIRKPFDEGRGPVVQQQVHDNNNGDPVFSVFAKFGCEGINSTICSPEIDKMIALASVQSGDERVKTWQKTFEMIFETVPDVMLFHQVGHSRIGPRLDFKPTIAMNSEIQLSQIKFK